MSIVKKATPVITHWYCIRSTLTALVRPKTCSPQNVNVGLADEAEQYHRLLAGVFNSELPVGWDKSQVTHFNGGLVLADTYPAAALDHAQATFGDGEQKLTAPFARLKLERYAHHAHR